jgi:SAM-dependent methyltransferase
VQEVERVVAEQLEYYRARAAEYDQYYERTGSFDRGPGENAAWLDELAQARDGLRLSQLEGRVLELAAGTGWWTEQLAATVQHVVAVDGAAETLEINRQRTRAYPNVELVEADLFAFEPEGSFDAIFFGFWLSHVPTPLFDTFWSKVREWLAPGGTALFIDNLESSAPLIQHRPSDTESELMRRTLNDGREFTIVKTVWTPESLKERLEPAWDITVTATGRFFIYGRATPTFGTSAS